MRKWTAFLSVLGLSLGLLAVNISILSAGSDSETEPNDTPEQANPLLNRTQITGAISPTGDQDYYAIDGVNPTWGFIALLETNSSTDSSNATLQALASDGTTVLQEDTSSWERGSGIALQNYVDGSETHYLRVNEEGNDATVSPYTIRHFQTIVASQPEDEPNDTHDSATPSSFTHEGVLNPPGDVDCFAFQGRVGNTILLALDSDPEGDSSTVDPVLRLITPSGEVLKEADVSGIAGKEFIEYAGLPEAGVYTYCVQAGFGVSSPAATYRVGIVQNGFLYFPDYKQDGTWLNGPPANIPKVGDVLSFRLAITNTSPITIPGNISLRGTYDPECLSLVDTNPSPSSSSPGTVWWEDLKTGLAPSEVYSVTMNLRAEQACTDVVHQSTIIDYYITGAGNDIPYTIFDNFIYLPVIRRSSP